MNRIILCFCFLGLFVGQLLAQDTLKRADGFNKLVHVQRIEHDSIYFTEIDQQEIKQIHKSTILEIAFHIKKGKRSKNRLLPSKNFSYIALGEAGIISLGYDRVIRRFKMDNNFVSLGGSIGIIAREVFGFSLHSSTNYSFGSRKHHLEVGGQATLFIGPFVSSNYTIAVGPLIGYRLQGNRKFAFRFTLNPGIIFDPSFGDVLPFIIPGLSFGYSF